MESCCSQAQSPPQRLRITLMERTDGSLASDPQTNSISEPKVARKTKCTWSRSRKPLTARETVLALIWGSALFACVAGRSGQFGRIREVLRST